MMEMTEKWIKYLIENNYFHFNVYAVNLEEVKSLIENTNLNKMSDDDFEILKKYEFLRNHFTLFNYFYLNENENIKDIFIGMLVYNSDKGRPPRLNLDQIYTKYINDIKQYNEDYEDDDNIIINDFLKVGLTDSLKTRFDIFKYSSTPSFRVDIRLISLILFGEDFLDKNVVVFSKIKEIDNYNKIDNFKKYIENLSRRYLIYPSDGQRYFDLNNFKRYVNGELKEYYQKALDLFDSKRIDDSFLFKLLYRINHKKVRNFIDELIEEENLSYKFEYSTRKELFEILNY